MSAGKIISYIVAGILIFFSVLFIWGSGDPLNGGGISWICIGVIGLAIGVGLIWFASRLGKAPVVTQNVTLNLDLPGKAKLDSLKCQSCGGALTSDNIKLVNGAPMVTCPFCNSTYQLTEEPKW
jgi:hypothetical protein